MIHARQPFRYAAGKTFHCAESAAVAGVGPAAAAVAVAADKGLAADAADGTFVGLKKAAEPCSSRGELPRRDLPLQALDAGLLHLMPHSKLQKQRQQMMKPIQTPLKSP